MFNFEDVGGKLKGLAKFFFGFSVVIAIGGGVVMLIFGLIDGLVELALLAPLASFVYCLLAWCAALSLYGIGQAVVNSDQLLAKEKAETSDNSQTITETKTSNYIHQTIRKMVTATNAEKKGSGVSENCWTCKKCGAHNPKTYLSCKTCGEYR